LFTYSKTQAHSFWATSRTETILNRLQTYSPRQHFIIRNTACPNTRELGLQIGEFTLMPETLKVRRRETEQLLHSVHEFGIPLDIY
jgi:hypothetical protein